MTLTCRVLHEAPNYTYGEKGIHVICFTTLPASPPVPGYCTDVIDYASQLSEVDMEV